MTRTTIYDSSGEIRYPADASEGDIDHEQIRDLFFQQVYLRVDGGTVNLNFYASTGTPEQFVAAVEVGHDESPIQTAHSELSRVVEEEMNWSMADPEAADIHQAFLSLPDIHPRGITRYSIDSLQAATAGESQTIDLGTPDTERAISVLHWLVQNTTRDLSIAITEDTRSSVLHDIDVVIVPGVTDDTVVGIDGSDADIRRRFLDSKAETTIDALWGDIPEQVQRSRATQIARGNLEWLIDQVPGDEYLAETSDETEHRIMKDLKVGGPVLAVVGLVVAFVLGGGIDALLAWWTTTVLGGDPVQLFTLTRVASLLGREPPAIPPRLLVGLSIVVLLVWTGIVVFFEKARLAAEGSNQQSNPHAEDASPQFGTKMNAIFEDIDRVSWADHGDLLNGLASRPSSIPGDMRVRSRSGERRERLLKVGGISLLAALVAGIVGYGIGLYLPVLLRGWKSIVEGLLIGGVLTVVVGVGLVVWKKLLNGP
jgi:hypothetical protein